MTQVDIIFPCGREWTVYHVESIRVCWCPGDAKHLVIRSYGIVKFQSKPILSMSQSVSQCVTGCTSCRQPLTSNSAVSILGRHTHDLIQTKHILFMYVDVLKANAVSVLSHLCYLAYDVDSYIFCLFQYISNIHCLDKLMLEMQNLKSYHDFNISWETLLDIFSLYYSNITIGLPWFGNICRLFC